MPKAKKSTLATKSSEKPKSDPQLKEILSQLENFEGTKEGALKGSIACLQIVSLLHDEDAVVDDDSWLAIKDSPFRRLLLIGGLSVLIAQATEMVK